MENAQCTSGRDTTQVSQIIRKFNIIISLLKLQIIRPMLGLDIYNFKRLNIIIIIYYIISNNE